jgi:biotin operon repressor
MDPIKDAFQNVKKDIDDLKHLKESVKENREKLIEICEIMQNLYKKINNLDKTLKQTDSTQKQENKTDSTHSSTHNGLFKPLKAQNMSISIGNEGASTDRQTDRQTNRQTQKTLKNQENTVDNAAEILDSLDNIKKEIRLKFRRLTEQEMLIFSTVYQLEEEKGFSDYKTISEKLNLTESSIRDYIGRLIKKGIPVEKTKINNKSVQLNISSNLKKIANLSTIMHLRDL